MANYCQFWSSSRVTPPQNENFIINHLPSCVMMHGFYAFWQLSDPPIDSNVINTINVQKRSNEIGKIIHVTSGVQP